jgi:predicted ATPase
VEGKRFIHSIQLKNILSFGSEGVEIDLQPLNVLIGPNGSGKSNFLEVIRLLKATPADFTRPISQGGGIEEWLWKGQDELPIAEMEVMVRELAGRLFARRNMAERSYRGNPLVAAIHIYIEGGGNSDSTKVKLRQGFDRFFEELTTLAA